MQKVFNNKMAIFLFVFPGILLFALTFLVPIVLSAYYSFRDTLSPGTPSAFIGFANYTELLFHDSRFWLALRNAVLLGLGFILIQHPIAIFLPLCWTAWAVRQRSGSERFSSSHVSFL